MLSVRLIAPILLPVLPNYRCVELKSPEWVCAYYGQNYIVSLATHNCLCSLSSICTIIRSLLMTHYVMVSPLQNQFMILLSDEAEHSRCNIQMTETTRTLAGGGNVQSGSMHFRGADSHSETWKPFIVCNIVSRNMDNQPHHQHTASSSTCNRVDQEEEELFQLLGGMQQ